MSNEHLLDENQECDAALRLTSLENIYRKEKNSIQIRRLAAITNQKEKKNTFHSIKSDDVSSRKNYSNVKLSHCCNFTDV